MQNSRNITQDLRYIGADDRKISLFENTYPTPYGMSYNSYVLLDEQCVIFDTVDASASSAFLEDVKFVLGNRKPNYLIVSHMEPDHSSTIESLAMLYPEMQIVCNDKSLTMLKNFFTFDVSPRALLVRDGDTLNCGKHTLKFIFTPMVHWPEVMMTYDIADKTLFTADAFGAYGALSGNIYADEADLGEYFSEMRRYYSNIVGKYGAQVLSALKKLGGLDIMRICPLHGLIWRDNFNVLLSKYQLWAAYEAEENSATVVYGSIYGNTANAAEILAAEIAKRGVKNIKVFDVAAVHHSYIISDVFRSNYIVFASATTNNEIFAPMENLIRELGAHGIKNRNVAIIQNGTWAPTAGAKICELVSTWKNTTISDTTVTITSSVKPENVKQLCALAEEIANTLLSGNISDSSLDTESVMSAKNPQSAQISANNNDASPNTGTTTSMKDAITTENAKNVYVCKICVYEYVGDFLPQDFICPLCKHPASDFVLKA